LPLSLPAGAGLGVRRARPWARGGVLLANAMLLYSALNSSGWLLHNQPLVVSVTAATFLGAVASAWASIRSIR
jgi:hypothetical protein